MLVQVKQIDFITVSLYLLNTRNDPAQEKIYSRIHTDAL